MSSSLSSHGGRGCFLADVSRAQARKGVPAWRSETCRSTAREFSFLALYSATAQMQKRKHWDRLASRSETAKQEEPARDKR